MKYRLLAVSIVFLALFVRLFGINWDGSFMLHPDERMLVMVAQRIQFFSQLNPQFFNYGSLPVYLLAGISSLFNSPLLYTGRFISALFDTGTIILIFFLATKLFNNKTIGLLASFIYAIAVFPVQNAHFFVVDPILTFFVSLLFLLLLHYKESQRVLLLIALSATCAAIISTKFTGIVFVLLAFLFVLFFNRKSLFLLLSSSLLFMVSCFLFTFLFMPYLLLSWHDFLRDILLQLKMNSNAYVFPYTLQYVDTWAYAYYVKNILFWGFGIGSSLLAIIGFIGYIRSKNKFNSFGFFLIYVSCFFFFLIVGRSAVKFMRYVLPLYPFFSILAGYGVWWLWKKNATIAKLLTLLLLLVSITSLLLFMRVYAMPNTRIQATEWILKNIPPGKTVATEHWDDRLPLQGAQNYKPIELQLYNQPDDQYKWTVIRNQLANTDYIILASNRLYAPLLKLSGCNSHRVCYPLTAKYYENLFSGKSNFTLVKKFDFQALPFDYLADESFSVYDHPTVWIFENSKIR